MFRRRTFESLALEYTSWYSRQKSKLKQPGPNYLDLFYSCEKELQVVCTQGAEMLLVLHDDRDKSLIPRLDKWFLRFVRARGYKILKARRVIGYDDYSTYDYYLTY